MNINLISKTLLFCLFMLHISSKLCFKKFYSSLKIAALNETEPQSLDPKYLFMGKQTINNKTYFTIYLSVEKVSIIYLASSETQAKDDENRHFYVDLATPQIPFAVMSFSYISESGENEFFNPLVLDKQEVFYGGDKILEFFNEKPEGEWDNDKLDLMLAFLNTHRFIELETEDPEEMYNPIFSSDPKKSQFTLEILNPIWKQLSKDISNIKKYKFENHKFSNYLIDRLIKIEIDKINLLNDFFTTKKDNLKTLYFSLRDKYKLELMKIPDNFQLISTGINAENGTCLLYTSPSPRDLSTSRMPSSA